MQDHEQQFQELLDRSLPRWKGIARCYCEGSDEEDLLQEIMMEVWKSLEQFAGRSRIETWAYRIALNTALTWSHRSRKRPSTIDAQAAASHVAGDETSSTRPMRILSEFMVSLSKMDRAVMLMFLDDVPGAEAAEICGLTEGALRVRMHRLRRKFESVYCERSLAGDV